MSELGPDARSILQAALAREGPTSADRERVRRALRRTLAAGGAATALTGAARAAAAKGTGTAGAAKVGLSASVAGKLFATLVLMGAAGVSLSPGARPNTPADPPSSRGIAAPSQTIAPPLRSPRETEAPAQEALDPLRSFALRVPPLPENGADPAPPALDGPDTPLAPAEAQAPASALLPPSTRPGAIGRPGSAPADPKTSATASAGAGSAASDTLEAETRGLRDAHGALQSGDPGRALSLLDEQSAAYANGELREERAAARVVALCALKRGEEAAAAATRFLRENPRSPFADRVRAACSLAAE